MPPRRTSRGKKRRTSEASTAASVKDKHVKKRKTEAEVVVPDRKENEIDNGPQAQKFCTCGSDDVGFMILCDGDCRKWYHPSCLDFVLCNKNGERVEPEDASDLKGRYFMRPDTNKVMDLETDSFYCPDCERHRKAQDAHDAPETGDTTKRGAWNADEMNRLREALFCCKNVTAKQLVKKVKTRNLKQILTKINKAISENNFCLENVRAAARKAPGENGETNAWPRAKRDPSVRMQAPLKPWTMEEFRLVRSYVRRFGPLDWRKKGELKKMPLAQRKIEDIKKQFDRNPEIFQRDDEFDVPTNPSLDGCAIKQMPYMHMFTYDQPRGSSSDDFMANYDVDRKNRLITVDLNPETPIARADLDKIYALFDRPDISVKVRGLANKLSPSIWNWTNIVEQHADTMCHSIKVFTRSDIFPRKRRGPKRKTSQCRERGTSKSKSVPAVKALSSAEDENVKRTFECEYLEDGWMSMTLRDYDRYLSARRGMINDISKDDTDHLVTLSDGNGSAFTIDPRETVLYLVDLNVTRYLPEAHRDLMENFHLRECLPGGRKCLHRFLPVEGRPFMGPNIYISPPGASTYFHQDGHGTVDSGHLCLAGQNEVILLPRLSEARTREAMDILRGNTDYSVRTEPHADEEFRVKPSWPTKETLGKLNAAGISYTALTLSHGEYLHINKGRLHIFRKSTNQGPHVSLEDLQRRKWQDICVSVAWDWVYEGYSPQGTEREFVQMLSAAAENRTLSSSVTRTVGSLGIPETTIVAAARGLLAKSKALAHTEYFFQHKRQNFYDQTAVKDSPDFRDPWTGYGLSQSGSAKNNALQEINLLNAFHSSLERIIKPYTRLVKSAKSMHERDVKQFLRRIVAAMKDKGNETSVKVNPKMRQLEEYLVIAALSGAWEEPVNDTAAQKNPGQMQNGTSVLDDGSDGRQDALSARLKAQTDMQRSFIFKSWALDAHSLNSGINPYAVEGYECMVCNDELANVYMHCMGCETLLRKDFNICVTCFKNHRGDILAHHKEGESRFSHLCHMGHVNWDQMQVKGKNCSSKQRSCVHCGFCTHCSCRCHGVYQMRFRFHSPVEMISLATKVKESAILLQINAYSPEYVHLRKLLEEAEKFDPAHPDYVAKKQMPQNLLPAWTCNECGNRNAPGRWYCSGKDIRRPTVRCNKKLLSIISHDVATFNRFGFFQSLLN